MKLFIGIPTRGRPHLEAHYSLVRAVEHCGVEATIRFQPSWHVVSARNQIVRDFLRSDCSHLCMVDDDVILPADALRRLCLHALDGRKVVVGVVPMFGGKALSSNVRLQGSASFAPLWPAGLQRVDEAGLAVSIMARDVFDCIEFPWFNWQESLSGDARGEDQDFCEKLASVGVEIWADGDIRCGHLKTVDLQRFSQVVCDRSHVRLLVTGAPRSGTKWAATALQRGGLDVGHEVVNRDGLTCWWFAARHADSAPPWAERDDIPRLYSVGQVIHLVRHPIACIDSISRMSNGPFKRAWVEWAERQIGPFSHPDPVIEAARFWLAWQRLVISLRPRARVRLEDGAGSLVDAVRCCGLECEQVRDPGPLNRVAGADPRETHARLRRRARSLLREIAELASPWGYEIEVKRAGTKAT